MRILIVEDEEKLAQALKRGLELKGFAVDWLGESEKALTRILLYRKEHDLIILDLMLPGIGGAEICKEARKQGVTTPIIILTARHETEHKVELLNFGADDYIVKPFSFDELLARINSVLRRPSVSLPVLLTVGSIEIDTKMRTVKKNNEEIPLTLKEYVLLEYFMRRPGEVLNREELFDHAWDFDFDSFSNVLDVHIKNLRKKLDHDNPKQSLLETVRGVGYRFKG